MYSGLFYKHLFFHLFIHSVGDLFAQNRQDKCDVSHVKSSVSDVKCHNVFLFFNYKVVELVGVGSVINGAYPV